VLEGIVEGRGGNAVEVAKETARGAKVALNRMLKVT
jgi:quinolinate synthase